MLKKFALVLFVILNICVVSFAEGEVGKITPEILEPEESNIHISENVSDVELIEEKIRIRLTEKSNLKRPEEFKSIMNCSPRAAYNNISAYTAFVSTYDFSPEQLLCINRILDKGTTIQSLIQVYEFWLTTDYDFSMVEQICDLEDAFFSEYWYESAFNHITDNIHGVLEYDDINYYYDMGISTEEILAANVLCRKEGQNIFNILDGAVNGVSVEEQAKEIYGAEDLLEGNSLHKSLEELSKASAKIQVVLSIDNTDATPVNVLAADADKILSDFAEKKVAGEAKRLGISQPEISPAEDFEALRRSRLPISVQRTLLNKGYTPEEIEQISKTGGWNINQKAKEIRRLQSR